MTERYFGFNPPFVGGPQKIMSPQSGPRLLANDVLQNLLILPGELPFRPTFGVNLRNFTFEKMNSSAISDLEEEISRQLLRNDPRLVIERLELTPDANNSTLTIDLVASIREDPDLNFEIKRQIKITGRS